MAVSIFSLKKSCFRWTAKVWADVELVNGLFGDNPERLVMDVDRELFL